MEVPTLVGLMRDNYFDAHSKYGYMIIIMITFQQMVFYFFQALTNTKIVLESNGKVNRFYLLQVFSFFSNM